MVPTEALRRLRAGVTAVSDLDLEACSSVTALDLAVAVQRELDRLQIAQARLLATADDGRATVGTPSRTAGDHVARRTGASVTELRSRTGLARLLDRHPLLAGAVRDGSVSPATAAVTGRVLDAAPEGADLEALLLQLHGVGPAHGRRIAEAWLHRVRDVARETEEAAAMRRFEQRTVVSSAEDDGMMRIVHHLPTLQARQYLAVLSAISGRPAKDDARSPGQRLADAVIALSGAYAAGDITGGHRERATMLIHMSAETFAGLTEEPATTAYGDRIPACVARQLAENAEIRRIVTAGAEILDHGRAVRYATRRQFEAMCARDGGCRVPGCTMPAAWCEADHLREWVAEHGETDLDEMVLFCPFHHHWRHRPGVRVHGNAHDLVLELPDGTRMPCPPRGPAIRRPPRATAPPLPLVAA